MHIYSWIFTFSRYSYVCVFKFYNEYWSDLFPCLCNLAVSVTFTAGFINGFQQTWSLLLVRQAERARFQIIKQISFCFNPFLREFCCQELMNFDCFWGFLIISQISLMLFSAFRADILILVLVLHYIVWKHQHHVAALWQVE